MIILFCERKRWPWSVGELVSPSWLRRLGMLPFFYWSLGVNFFEVRLCFRWLVYENERVITRPLIQDPLGYLLWRFEHRLICFDFIPLLPRAYRTINWQLFFRLTSQDLLTKVLSFHFFIELKYPLIFLRWNWAFRGFVRDYCQSLHVLYQFNNITIYFTC